MLYQRPKFSCPASSGTSTSEKDWDRAFLQPTQFREKYGESPENTTSMTSVPDCTGFST